MAPLFSNKYILVFINMPFYNGMHIREKSMCAGVGAFFKTACNRIVLKAVLL
jgi:hypothetical protein